jgi:hypothetical protein
MVAFDRNDEGGEVAVADDLAELPFGAEPDAPATPRVQAVIAGRLGQLSQPAATLAGVAAAIGRAFTADVLAAGTELEERRSG